MILSTSFPGAAEPKPSFGEVCLAIADISISITSVAPDMKIHPGAEMSRFRVPRLKADVNLEASWQNLTAECGWDRIFDSGGSWKLFAEDGCYLYQCFAATLGPVPYAIARFNRDFNFGEVYLHRPHFDPGQAVYPLQYPLDELMMLHILSRGSGVEIHACGLVDISGNGYVFAGQSGAGKTTMARLWERERGVTILSDDRIILRRTDGHYWMYGTPWHGEAEFAQPQRALLKKVFLLRHGSENAIVRKTGAEAAAHLFSCTFPTFYDRGGLEFTLGFYEELIKNIPCYELSVVPDYRVVESLRQHAG